MASEVLLFQLSDASITDGDTWTGKIKITRSTLGDLVPEFDTSESPIPPFTADKPFAIFVPTDSEGVVYGHVEIDDSGNIMLSEIAFGTDLPVDDATNFYIQIGGWVKDDDAETMAVVNDLYGPIIAESCRNWFSSDVSYGVTLIGSPA